MSLPNSPKKIGNASIGNIRALAQTLSLTQQELDDASNLLVSSRFERREVPKSPGGVRVVYNPSPLLRRTQHRINTRILKPLVQWPDYLFGSIPNSADPLNPLSRDYISCAAKHCGAKSILSIDVENFFENVHRDYVFEIFHSFFHYPKDVAECLTNCCCHNDALVQGGLTSSYLATLALWDVEFSFVQSIRRKKLIYTRLVDDITISSTVSRYNFDDAKHQLREMLLKKGLPVNAEKTRIQYSGMAPLSVHGLRVSFSTPRLPADEVRNIRASVHNVVAMSKVNNYRTSSTYRSQFNRSMGRVNKLARVGHNKHKHLLSQLKNVLPLPSRRDIEKARRSLKWLENQPNANHKTRKYKRKYFINLHRIAIINRTFEDKAEKLLERMAIIRPPSAKKKPSKKSEISP